MKKIFRFVSLLLLVVLVAGVVVPSLPAKASEQSDMETVLSDYTAGDYASAKAANEKLPAVSKEACVKKMSAKMKKAYKKVIAGYKGKPTTWFAFYYYLTDLNNDGKAELLVYAGKTAATTKLRAYQYKGGKAKKIAEESGGAQGAGLERYFCEYPGHEGFIIYVRNSMVMAEEIEVVTVQDGTFHHETIGQRVYDLTKNDLVPLRDCLYGHVNVKNGKTDYKAVS